MGNSVLFDAYCGIGDNIHQRPFVLDALKRYKNVYIHTAFPDIFYAGTGVKCLPKKTNLPAVNARVEWCNKRGLYAIEPRVVDHRVRFNYGHFIPILKRPILRSFNEQFKHSDFNNISIRFDCKESWKDEARKVIGRKAKGKKICYVKLPTLRDEWVGMKELSRNPCRGYVEHIAKMIGDDYYMVSALDLKGYKETLFADIPNCIDLVAHNGEFSFEGMLGLAGIADLIITPPCNTLLLGIAFDVPTFGIFGGFSPSRIYTEPLVTPYYGFVAPKNDCYCFNVNHACEKTIPLTVLEKEFKKFMENVEQEKKIAKRRGRPSVKKESEMIKEQNKKSAVSEMPKRFWLKDDPTIELFKDSNGRLYRNVIRHGVERVLYVCTEFAICD